MSSEASAAVVVRGLTKRYRLPVAQETTAAELVVNRFRRPLRHRARTTFEALTNVDLTVHDGEALGIVGHNGAGKSTLLKILSRITEPSKGSVKIRGRVGSLLEVGTGFHPELTGRENVYLNGSILGMRRQEVDRAFDEIVDFAGVERFLDLPVKRYSSGMSVRLAFAVAASLTADVLIIDEVLAVGDIEFQNKCMKRMAEMSHGGRTVLFVSHNLAAVQALCTRAVLLSHGRVIQEGTPEEVVAGYLTSLRAAGELTSAGVHDVRLDEKRQLRPHLRRVSTRVGSSLAPSEFAQTGQTLIVDVRMVDAHLLERPQVGVSFWTEIGTLVATIHTQMTPARATGDLGSDRTFRLTIEPLPLLPGRYWLDIGVRSGGEGAWFDLASKGADLTVLPGDVYGTGSLPESREGLVYLPGAFTVS